MFLHVMAGYSFHRIRKIIARIRKMMMSHFPIVHAILPINPRITNVTAIMRNNIPSVKSQSRILYHHWRSVHYFGVIFFAELGSIITCMNGSGSFLNYENT
jgi:hypothetical protein